MNRRGLHLCGCGEAILHAGWSFAAAGGAPESELSEHMVPQGEVGCVVGALEGEGGHCLPLPREGVLTPKGAACPPQAAEPDQESRWGAYTIPSVFFLKVLEVQ